MTTVADITAWLEQFAPSRLAEPWDNVGLLWGDPGAPAERVMTCLTVTPASAAEAIREQAGLIVSHHPVLFREVKKIRADLPETGYLWNLARAGIAIASPHTAFDNTHDGINDILCRRLGLVEVAPLAAALDRFRTPVQRPRSFKVVVFTPEAEREAVSAAAFAAGAGRIGAYEECSFAIPGEGTFFGTDAANPTVGERGRRETVRELRLEFVCPATTARRCARVDPCPSFLRRARDRRLSAARRQRGAIDSRPAGAGRIGNSWRNPRVSSNSPCSSAGARAAFPWRWPAIPNARSGASRSPAAPATISSRTPLAPGPTCFLTGEARFHRALEAEALGIGLLTAGHYATERPGVEELAEKIALAFPAVTVWPSRDERDPLRFVGADRSLTRIPGPRAFPPSSERKTPAFASFLFGLGSRG